MFRTALLSTTLLVLAGSAAAQQQGPPPLVAPGGWTQVNRVMYDTLGFAYHVGNNVTFQQIPDNPDYFIGRLGLPFPDTSAPTTSGQIVFWHMDWIANTLSIVPGGGGTGPCGAGSAGKVQRVQLGTVGVNHTGGTLAKFASIGPIMMDEFGNLTPITMDPVAGPTSGVPGLGPTPQLTWLLDPTVFKFQGELWMAAQSDIRNVFTNANPRRQIASQSTYLAPFTMAAGVDQSRAVTLVTGTFNPTDPYRLVPAHQKYQTQAGPPKGAVTPDGTRAFIYWDSQIHDTAFNCPEPGGAYYCPNYITVNNRGMELEACQGFPGNPDKGGRTDGKKRLFGKGTNCGFADGFDDSVSVSVESPYGGATDWLHNTVADMQGMYVDQATGYLYAFTSRGGKPPNSVTPMPCPGAPMDDTRFYQDRDATTGGSSSFTAGSNMIVRTATTGFTKVGATLFFDNGAPTYFSITGASTAQIGTISPDGLTYTMVQADGITPANALVTGTGVQIQYDTVYGANMGCYATEVSRAAPGHWLDQDVFNTNRLTSALLPAESSAYKHIIINPLNSKKMLLIAFPNLLPFSIYDPGKVVTPTDPRYGTAYTQALSVWPGRVITPPHDLYGGANWIWMTAFDPALFTYN